MEVHVRSHDPRDPAGVWKKLADIFEQPTVVNRLMLHRRLLSTKLSETGNAQEHINTLSDISGHLMSISKSAQLDENFMARPHR
ncbi:hypothetical protein CXG81DRAFT_29030 [Caulochytrium protostelioides]|uniref:Uncharacterized protein n=1 Tax=Caulochytrium protostelioides TaxID=1555241 RepID=A0A4P9X004_9FUNG|nr:hypothetical protein CXG81DRAFT_29030 [Caulochytrium protostelioides]|eukprot:RKO98195.1 hypothetical protein CXG81DRAFT_29030 [Caulochytrium protostelioides]